MKNSCRLFEKFTRRIMIGAKVSRKLEVTGVNSTNVLQLSNFVFIEKGPTHTMTVATDDDFIAHR